MKATLTILLLLAICGNSIAFYKTKINHVSSQKSTITFTKKTPPVEKKKKRLKKRRLKTNKKERRLKKISQVKKSHINDRKATKIGGIIILVIGIVGLIFSSGGGIVFSFLLGLAAGSVWLFPIFFFIGSIILGILHLIFPENNSDIKIEESLEEEEHNKEEESPTPNSKVVLYLKNGSKIKGKIIEIIPNKTVKIETADGSIFVFKMKEVKKIEQEESE